MISIAGLPRTGTTSLEKALDVLGEKYSYGIRQNKIILTVRQDRETWWKSMCNKATCLRYMNLVSRMGDPFENKDKYTDYYDEYNEKIIKLNPLVVCWECGDGWKQLCDYLNMEIPEVEFPHLNSSK